MPENLFCERPFIIQYILENKIEVILLADTYAIRYGFIDKKFVEEVCQVLKIKSQRLIKLKQI